MFPDLALVQAEADIDGRYPPTTSAEMKKGLEEHLDELTMGNEPGKVRIVLE